MARPKTTYSMFRSNGLLLYMKTIGYFGDSFCASKNTQSWCVLLANKLNLEIKHWGTGGASIWNTILEFNQIKIKPDVIIFCWTNPNRLYHPTLPLTPNAVPIATEDPNVFKAAESYYKYLQNDDKDKLAYTYALQWFDQNVLSEFENEHKIIQSWSFFPADITLNTGDTVDFGMMQFAWGGNKPTDAYKDDINLFNHMTAKQNQQWADMIKDRI